MPTPKHLVSDLTAAKKRLKHNPEIRHIEMMIPDINGCIRGKWLPISALDSLYTQGVRLPGSVFALDFWGNEVLKSGLVSENGDPDSVCLPVAGGFTVHEQTSPPTAQVLVNMYNVDETPFMLDPSQIIDSLISRLKEKGMTPVVAMEMEFHLFDETSIPGIARTQATSNVYCLDELDHHRALFNEIYDICLARGIPADTIITEAGANQFEINLVHIDDAKKACEHALLLKRIIKNTASKHGLTASFMAKPLADDAGNGMHTNISLIDNNGKNLFASNNEHGSVLMQHATAGLLDCMLESTLLFAPHANSYRRFQPGAHAPTAVCWGIDNRNVAIRLPQNAGQAMRIEHRVAGADANPFLVVAAILAGILHGIENTPALQAATSGIPEHTPVNCVPHHWDQAVSLFRDSSILSNALGEQFCAVYHHTKVQEIDAINSMISDIEYRRYLTQS